MTDAIELQARIAKAQAIIAAALDAAKDKPLATREHILWIAMNDARSTLNGHEVDREEIADANK